MISQNTERSREQDCQIMNDYQIIISPPSRFIGAQGTNARFARTHIDTLRKQNTLPKSVNNLRESGNRKAVSLHSTSY